MDHSSLPSGTKISGYKIESELGRGGFGITYLATDLALNNPVAIKEYFPSDFCWRHSDRTSVVPMDRQDSDFRWGLNRFLDEGRTLVQFNSPYVVNVMRFFDLNGTAYLVMEYIDGLPIDAWALKVTSPQAIFDTFKKICEGLKIVHAHGFLHRDIKPDNILIRKVDQQPLIIDFGSARRETANRTIALVTPYYSPVEQYASDTDHGPYTDIYSLTASFYKIIKGKAPPDSPSRVLSDTCEPLSGDKGLSSFPSDFLRMLDSGMAPIPSQRPQNIDDLLAIKGNPSTETGKKPKNFSPPKSAEPKSVSEDLTLPDKTFLRWSLNGAVTMFLVVFIVAIFNLDPDDSARSQQSSNVMILSEETHRRDSETPNTEFNLDPDDSTRPQQPSNVKIPSKETQGRNPETPNTESILFDRLVLVNGAAWTKLEIPQSTQERLIKQRLSDDVKLEVIADKAFRVKNDKAIALSARGGIKLPEGSWDKLSFKNAEDSSQYIRVIIRQE